MTLAVRVLHLLFIFAALLSPGRALAQGDGPAAARALTAVRLAEADVIRIDGVPDEPSVGARAARDVAFLQREPDNGAPATERTEVRLVFDADRLILGVMLHDTEPNRVLGNQMQRDQSFDADDRFMWTIDTFLDGRTGYFFEINPAGAMGDGLVDPASDPGWNNDFGAGINRSWDGIWMARVRRTATGWTAEVEMPFRTVNFDPEAAVGHQLPADRSSQERRQPVDRARAQSGAGAHDQRGPSRRHLGLSQGLGLDLKPYAVGNMSSAPGRGRPEHGRPATSAWTSSTTSRPRCAPT